MQEYPRVLWTTPLQRRIIDLQVTASNDRNAAAFKTYADDAGAQIGPLRRYVLLLYLATFLLAFLTLAGGIPSDVTVEAFGVGVPLSLFSQQAVAAVTAGLFAQYVISLTSFGLLFASIQSFLSPKLGDGWEFAIARYDAGLLHTMLLTPRTIGYRSPKREWAFTILVLLAGFASIIVHFAVVILGAISAMQSAIKSQDGIAMTLAGFSMFGTVVPAAAFLASTLIPMPYRMR